MAGGLGVRLAGPRSYDGVRVDEAWLGDGREVEHGDLGRALRVYRRAWLLGSGLVWTLGAIGR